MTGNKSTFPVDELARLGDALERSAVRDLDTAARDLPARRSRRRPSRRVLVLVAAVAAIASGASFAAVELTGVQEVAASMPAGTLWLAGTEPTCTVVTENVEYHCVLTNPPTDGPSDWKGTVEETVDATHHVNGGCRSLTSDGMEWECYIGEAAVSQQIISQGFLGQVTAGPSVV